MSTINWTTGPDDFDVVIEFLWLPDHGVEIIDVLTVEGQPLMDDLLDDLFAEFDLGLRLAAQMDEIGREDWSNEYEELIDD